MSMPDAASDRLSGVRRRHDDLAVAWQETLRELPTPCLVIDADAAQRNCYLAADSASARSLTIRPHVKAHKCSELLRFQVAAGAARGVTCATVYEAEALVAHGFRDILLANEIVSAAACRSLANVAMAADEVRVAVDSDASVLCASAAARAAECRIGILIDVDVGSGRCGIVPKAARVRSLASNVLSCPGLRLDGIMAYTGRANYHARPERQLVADAVRKIVRRVSETLGELGIEAPVISGGSTGTWDLDQGLTELQLGSYVLMEGRYASIDTPFVPAVFCATTVISRQGRSHAVLDCGWKAVSAELGLPVAPADTTALKMGDEHTILRVMERRALEVGEVLLLLPEHLDPTMNLHDRVVAFAGGAVEEWPVDIRRQGQLVRRAAELPSQTS